MKKNKTFMLVSKKMMACMGVFVCIVFAACTDYLQKLEDEHDEWRAQQSDTAAEQSSSSISEIVLSSETRLSSSDGASVPDVELSSAESILSSSDEVEINSSSSFELPEISSDSVDDETVTLKKLPVMMFDWLHGSMGDGDGEGKNGDSANGISADFGSSGCAASVGPLRGMVKQSLGPNGVPVRADPFPSDCKITEHLDSWFIPESLAVDARGNTLTNMTCRALYISMDDDGFWLAEISRDALSQGNESSRGGMFLLDDFKYLDEANTIPNPYYDQLRGGADNKNHNFGFTMKIQATFVYQPGLYFDFLGDDDVWVFINNRLVVDIGGQHPQMAGAVDLDTLGLTVGETYPFHIFYAERHTSQSNFRMHTSIDLKLDPSFPCH